jgi:hypothetical protein
LSGQQRGFILTRHWRDTPDGTDVDFWLATDDGPRHLRLRPQESVAFIPAAHRERAESVMQRENARSCGRLNWLISVTGRCSGFIPRNIGN